MDSSISGFEDKDFIDSFIPSIISDLNNSGQFLHVIKLMLYLQLIPKTIYLQVIEPFLPDLPMSAQFYTFLN